MTEGTEDICVHVPVPLKAVLMIFGGPIMMRSKSRRSKVKSLKSHHRTLPMLQGHLTGQMLITHEMRHGWTIAHF